MFLCLFRYITGLHSPSREESSWSAAKAMSSLEEHRDLFHRVRNNSDGVCISVSSRQNLVFLLIRVFVFATQLAL